MASSTTVNSRDSAAAPSWPLVRKFKLSDDEWVVLAVNPWQAEDARSTVSIPCGARSWQLPLQGRHTGIFVVQGGRVTKK